MAWNSLQSPQKAGLYLYKRLWFLSLRFWGFYCAFCGWEKRRNLCTKRVHTMFTSLYCKHCTYCIISTIQDMARDIVRLRTARQNRILRLSFPLFINSVSEHIQRKAISQSRFVSISLYYYRSYGQCHMPLQRLIF